MKQDDLLTLVKELDDLSERAIQSPGGASFAALHARLDPKTVLVLTREIQKLIRKTKRLAKENKRLAVEASWANYE